MLHKRVKFGWILVLGLALSTGSRSRSLPAQAADVPNLSGAWELIQDGYEKKGPGDPQFPQVTLVISQEGSELKITRKKIRRSTNRKLNGTLDVREFIYHTDGRGDTNLGRYDLWREAPKLKSVTRLGDNKILTEFDQQVTVGISGRPLFRGPYNYEMPTTMPPFEEEWSLSEAGKKLVLNTMSYDFGGGARRKYVFRKIS